MRVKTSDKDGWEALIGRVGEGRWSSQEGGGGGHIIEDKIERWILNPKVLRKGDGTQIRDGYEIFALDRQSKFKCVEAF